MNFLYHSVYKFSFALFIISSIVYNQVVISKRCNRSHNVIRRKRIWNGTEIKDNKFPYVVYLQILHFEENGRCSDRQCTGTIIHPYFVVTTKNCILHPTHIFVNNRIGIGSNIKIFLKRPYDQLNTNISLTYNIGSNVELTHNTAGQYETDDIALILMNDTFPEIKKFPIILMLDPLPLGKTLPCTAVGFSFIGTKFSHPVADLVGPSTYEITAEFSVSKCISRGRNNNERNDSRYANAFMCFTGPQPLDRTLCGYGDEGSPLLCKLHEGSKKPERSQPPFTDNNDRSLTNEESSTKENSTPNFNTSNRKRDNSNSGNGSSNGDGGDEMGLYGIGIQEDTLLCNSNATPNNMFLYMLKYGAWINTILNDFDDHQKHKNESNAATVETTTNTIITTTTTPIPLPEYYDTDLYDDTSKKPKRCNDDVFSWFTTQNHVNHHPSNGPLAMVIFWSLIAIATMSV